MGARNKTTSPYGCFWQPSPVRGTGVDRRHFTLRPGRRIRREATDTEVCVDAVRTSADSGAIVCRKLLLSAACSHFYIQTINITDHSDTDPMPPGITRFGAPVGASVLFSGFPISSFSSTVLFVLGTGPGGELLSSNAVGT